MLLRGDSPRLYTKPRIQSGINTRLSAAPMHRTLTRRNEGASAATKRSAIMYIPEGYVGM